MFDCKDCLVECYESCEINVKEKALRNNKKQPTPEKIQMTEEQARDFLKFATGIDFKDEMFFNLKQAGYIRKSAVEEAEEIMTRELKIWSIEEQKIIMKGWLELKAEKERLKNE